MMTKLDGIYARSLKRALDFLAAILLLPVMIPVIFCLALIVARDGHSPFFLQNRIGRGGRIFVIVKLRTMVPDAADILLSHLKDSPKAAAEWGRTQKLINDPRITRFGRVLRKLSLDELPQIWNVLIGQMSFVGPRPMLTEQQRLYPGQVYYRLRPGITGPWQVSGRHETEFAHRARYDRQYAETISFRTDVRLLLRTTSVVLRATGV